MSIPTIEEYEESPEYEFCPCYSAYVYVCGCSDEFNCIPLGRASNVMHLLNLDAIERWEGDSDSVTLHVNPTKPLLKSN